jgi:TPR repeat protein
MAPLDRERVQRLMQKGNQELEDGNVSSARFFYEYAADAGLAQAAMALVATFDPTELAKLEVRGIAPDAKEARRWYERARQLGAAGAGQRITRLGAP